jgi:hypothetical protein
VPSRNGQRDGVKKEDFEIARIEVCIASGYGLQEKVTNQGRRRDVCTAALKVCIIVTSHGLTR